MKVKILRSLACLLFISNVLFSQSPEVELIKHVEEDRQHEKSFLAFKDDDGFILADTKGDVKFVLATPKERVKLLRYDNDFNLSWSKELKPSGDKSTMYFRQFNDKIFWFATEWTSKGKLEFFVNQVSPDGEKGDWKSIGAYTKKNKKDSAPSFLWKVSPNKKDSYILVIDDGDNDKKKKFNVSVIKLDKNLDVKWTKSIDFEKSQFELNFRTSRITDSGIFTLLLLERKLGKKSSYRNKIVRFDSNSGETKEIVLDISPNRIEYYSLKLLENNRIIFFGTFSNQPLKEKGSKKNVNGYYIFDIDKNGDLLQKIIHNFTKSDLANVGENNVTINNDGAIGLHRSFGLNEFVFDKKRNIYSIILDYKEQTKTSVVRTQHSTIGGNDYYQHKDIVYFFLNENGKLIRSGNIPRFQESTNNKQPNGFITELIEGKGFYFTYNEGKKNSLKSFNQKYGKGFRNKVLVSALAEYDGKKTKYIHENISKGNPFLLPSWTIKINDDSKLIYFKKDSKITHNKYHMGKLNYPK